MNDNNGYSLKQQLNYYNNLNGLMGDTNKFGGIHGNRNVSFIWKGMSNEAAEGIQVKHV